MMKKIFCILLLFGLLFMIWSVFIEPNLLQSKTYKLPAPKFKGSRIVFASDMHIAPNHHKRLNRIVKKINRCRPDLVILGGDFVKGHKKSSSMPIERIAAALSKIKAPGGIYAVLGNHDWWYGGENIAAALEAVGIKVLANNSRTTNLNGTPLCLAGVEDITTRRPNILQALKNCHEDTILISHSPDIFPDVPQNVMLTLAGHTHGGQITLPLIGAPVVPSKFGQRYARGLIEEKGRKMIVSQGLGTSLLPIRFNTLPEIVILIFE